MLWFNRPIQPVDFPSNVPKSSVLTTQEINITTIPEFYERLANGVNVVIDIIYNLDVSNEMFFFINVLLSSVAV